MSSDLHNIEQVLQTSFDGLYEGDTSKLARAVHRVAHLRSSKDGELEDMSQEQWFAPVKGRQSAQSRDLPRRKLDAAGRPLRPTHRVRQGALPDPAPLFR